MANWFFPKNYSPKEKPAPKPGPTAEERDLLRDALLSAVPIGSDNPIRMAQAVDIIKATVPRFTRSECHKLALYVQDLWYPDGPPSYYAPDEEE